MKLNRCSSKSRRELNSLTTVFSICACVQPHYHETQIHAHTHVHKLVRRVNCGSHSCVFPRLTMNKQEHTHTHVRARCTRTNYIQERRAYNFTVKSGDTRGNTYSCNTEMPFMHGVAAQFPKTHRMWLTKFWKLKGKRVPHLPEITPVCMWQRETEIIGRIYTCMYAHIYILASGAFIFELWHVKMQFSCD